MDYFDLQSAVAAFGTNLFLTIYVLVKGRGWTRHLNRNFALLSLTFVFWNGGMVFDLGWMFYGGLLLVSPALHMFLMTLLRNKSIKERRINGILWILSALLILFYSNNQRLEIVHKLFSFFFIAPIGVLGVTNLFKRIRITNSRRENLRLWYVLVGMSAAGIGGLTSLASSFYKPVPSLGILGGLIYTVLITVAIMRHRLFDFGRLAGRSVVIFVFTFIFWCLLGILGNWYHTPYTSLLSILIATLVLVVLYEPLTMVIEGQADRVLSRESYRFVSHLENFSRTMSTLVSEKQLLKSFAKSLRETSRVKSFGIYLITNNRQSLTVIDGDEIRWTNGAQIDIPSLLFETFLYSHRVVNKSTISQEIRSGLPSVVRRHRIALFRILLRFRAHVCFPFIFAEEIIGFLSIGFSDPEAGITRREEIVLTTVTRQFAAALSNARLIEREKLRDRLAALGHLASGLAHEIQNPLATIKATFQYLQSQQKLATDDDFIMIIQEEIERLNRFVRRFLDYARPSSENHEYKTAAFFEIIRRIQLPLKARSDCESIEFLTEISPDAGKTEVPLDIWIQILNNLIENAIQALENKGIIKLNAHLCEKTHSLIVAIEDSGPGIPEKDFDRIFQPFYTSRDTGTGLGLAIVQQNIQRLKGDIQIGRSVLGGAFFRLIQPLDKLNITSTGDASSTSANVNKYE
ncbi:GHKL domain-containing protein [bacterium]|nr:GHKL domain-containing protein [candidate division CSSED10-310 bacterium]